MKSIFKEYITMFIENKRYNGYDYITEEERLKNFDDYVFKNKIIELSLTKELIFEFLQTKRQLKTTSISNYASALREFAKYLNLNNINAYVLPNNYYRHRTNFVPYIFSENEIRDFFGAMNSIRNEDARKRLNLIFKLLYSTGIRVSECADIKNENINFENNTITLKNTKNDTDRLIVIDNKLMKEIRTIISDNEYLFINPNTNKKYTNKIIYDNFRRILYNAKIMHTEKGPRVHDFRHTFAVRSYMQAIKDNKDLNVYLPILSTYLGHKNLESTSKYIRLTEEMFPDIRNKIENINNIPNIEGIDFNEL